MISSSCQRVSRGNSSRSFFKKIESTIFYSQHSHNDDFSSLFLVSLIIYRVESEGEHLLRKYGFSCRVHLGRVTSYCPAWNFCWWHLCASPSVVILKGKRQCRFNWPWLKSVVTHLLIVCSPYFTNTSGIAREALVPPPNSDQCSGASRGDRTRAFFFLISKACCWIPVPYVREDVGKWHSILQEYTRIWFFMHKCQSFSLWQITFGGIIFCLCEKSGPIAQSCVQTFLHEHEVFRWI